MEYLDLKPYLGHLSSSVGHLVINAFSTIVSQGEILRTLNESAGQQPREVAERIDTLIRTALDASRITRRLIELSHDWTSVDADQSGSPVEEIRLDQLISEFVDTEKARWGPSVGWVLNLASIPPIHGQVEPLWVMFRQFVRNAVESFPTGAGTITISSQPAPRNWLVVEIRDDGCGMTAEVLEHALEPFYSTKPDHLGIGLAIARGIWRRHRGTMSVDSQPGEGTTVRLSAAALESTSGQESGTNVTSDTS
ncbi:MAG: HAMP domain-containing histidine kinase [Planctomycetaceae bacterium]|nr:HAMP domain-containing histidine kinase [Planctomycetaceae bacterium]